MNNNKKNIYLYLFEHSWFVPVIVIGGLSWFFFTLTKGCNERKIEENKLVREINTRIDFSRKSMDYCYKEVQKSKGYAGSHFIEEYNALIANLLLPEPYYFTIDTIYYQKEFRDINLINLLQRLKIISNKYDKDIDYMLSIINKIKNFYSAYEHPDSIGFCFMSIIINDSLKIFKE
jgi:hypothetical protein